MRHAIDEQPVEPGLYVVEIHFGWKLLEWVDGAWWHMAKVGRWMASDPVQWVGPLPPTMLIKGKKGLPPEVKTYDL